LYARYRDQVDVFVVYIREAHPADGWRMAHNDQLGVTFDQPKTQEARNLVASSCCQSLRFSMPLLVDTIDDQVNRAYSGFPDRLYLLDREGRVVYKGGRGPYHYNPRELEQSLLLLFLEEALARTTEPAGNPEPAGDAAQTPETAGE
jgi:hypothetical protein